MLKSIYSSSTKPEKSLVLGEGSVLSAGLLEAVASSLEPVPKRQPLVDWCDRATTLQECDAVVL
eukprot:4376741-Amphidinium_carterae.2